LPLRSDRERAFEATARPLAILLLLACLLAPLGAAPRIGAWVPLFQGVDYARGHASAGDPRRQEAFAVRIDLGAPGVALLTTPPGGTRRTQGETTRDFLAHHGLQVAINANFFKPCCEPGDKDLIGLAIAAGQVVSPPRAKGIGAAALVVTRDNRAAILRTGPGFRPDRYWTAVAGSEIILAGGVRSRLADLRFNRDLHPRTAVGLTRRGRHLILLAIDGRQPGYSEGATMAETADWLRRFGARDGLNLDGGGSTTLVREADGRPRVLNRPSGIALGSSAPGFDAGGEPQLRVNGNNLGVFAKPLVP